ncbi:MAG: hypothetical protein ACKVP2_02785 [Burkholderiales bacterium]
MKNLAKCLLPLCLFCIQGIAQAQQTLEVITLKYRSAEQVIPILKPLLAPGGTLSGMQYNLVIRTTPQNLAELRKVLETVDSMPRRLVISVRQDSAGSGNTSQAEIAGSIGTDKGRVTVPGRPNDQGATVVLRRGDDRVGARVLNSQSAATDRNVQTVQVLEGSEAVIRVGQSVPVRSRSVIQTPQGTQISESVEYRDADTGFRVRPRIGGDRVTLEIVSRRDSVSDPNIESFNIQRVETVVSGRLGEWIEFGGVGQSHVQSDNAAISRRTSAVTDDRKIYLKVEEIR